MSDFLLVTCEHGGNRIPPPYDELFRSPQDRALLTSHRGFDPGALTLAEELASALKAPLVASTVSRLLIDLNRSIGHAHLHSQAIRQAPPELRRELVDRYYRPYRLRAESLVQRSVDQGRRVLHISCHSFTPELDGHVREADIGLLYDPRRMAEVALCKGWQASLKVNAPELGVRRNYPYEGKNDGFTTYLRRRFSVDEYVGVELEVNQKHILEIPDRWPTLRATLIASLRKTLSA